MRLIYKGYFLKSEYRDKRSKKKKEENDKNWLPKTYILQISI